MTSLLDTARDTSAPVRHSNLPRAKPDQIRRMGYVERDTPNLIVMRARFPSRPGRDELDHWRPCIPADGWWELFDRTTRDRAPPH